MQNILYREKVKTDISGERKNRKKGAGILLVLNTLIYSAKEFCFVLGRMCLVSSYEVWLGVDLLPVECTYHAYIL